MSNRIHRRPSFLAAAAGAALAAASVAQAQSSWAGAVSDSWFNAARWSPAAVPNSSATNVVLGLAGPYTVSMQNASAQCGTLTLSNSGAALNIFDNSSLTAYGTVNNSGLIQVSAPGAPGNGTLFNAASPISITGSGTLRLAASGSNGDSDAAYLYHNGSGANTITQASGHTIAGYGRVYASLINNGTVNADQNGKGLLMIGSAKTNNALVTASNGGFVQFRSVALSQGPSGVCTSGTASPVQFVSSSVSGGTLNGAGTAVQFYGSSTLDGVTLQNTNAVTDNAAATIGAAGVINNGTWTINDPAAPGNNSYINTATPTTVSGTGTIRLQATASNGDADSAYLYHNGNGANTLTNAGGHSIKGYGRIYTGLINNGTVNADIAAKGLFMIGSAKTNNGTMTASNGGFLQFRGVSVTGNPTAQIISTDAASPVQFVSSTLSGGGFTTAGTGIFQYYGTNTLSNLTVNGTHSVTDNSSVHLATDLVNNGTWKVSDPTAPGNNAHFGADAPVTISGTGSIILQGVQTGNGDNDSAYLYHNGSGANTITLGANQTLSGYGRIYTTVINNGVIHANNSPNSGGPASKGLVFHNQPKTNNATITTSNGGFWHLRGITMTQGSGGVMSTQGASTGGVENSTIAGGTITSSAAGPVSTYGISAINGATITPGSVVQISDNSTMNTSGLTNNGTIQLSTPAAPGNGSVLQSPAPGAVLSGSGVVRLQGPASGNGDNGAAYLYHNGNGANTMTQTASHSIKGYGRIYTRLTNDGTINADVSGKGLILMDQTKINNSTITSTNGGFWYARGITINQGSSGVMSTQAASTGGIENATISGGTITSSAAGPVVTVATATLDAVTLSAGSVIQVNDNSSLSLSTNGMVNNGSILVDTIGAPGNSAVVSAPGSATISGTGTVRLQATGFGNNSAYLNGLGNAANPLTLGSGQVLTGTGRFFGNVVVNGTISPDQPFGTPTALGSIQPMGSSLVLGATSAFNCQLGGATSFDSMQGTSAVTISPGATLNVSIAGVYDPSPGTFFDIVTGSSVTGTFTNVNFPPLLNKKQSFLIYGPTYVRLYVTCYANCDGSSTSPILNANDFQCFLNKFASADPYANCDGSSLAPIHNANDFQCFLNAYAAGCNN